MYNMTISINRSIWIDGKSFCYLIMRQLCNFHPYAYNSPSSFSNDDMIQDVPSLLYDNENLYPTYTLASHY